MQQQEIAAIVEQSVESTLLKLGIDISTPEKVLQFQEDMRYLREWRASMATIRRTSITAAIGTLVTGILAVLALGVRHMLMRGGGG